MSNKKDSTKVTLRDVVESLRMEMLHRTEAIKLEMLKAETLGTFNYDVLNKKMEETDRLIAEYKGQKQLEWCRSFLPSPTSPYQGELKCNGCQRDFKDEEDFNQHILDQQK